VLAALTFALFAAAQAGGDTYMLMDGDRISGRTINAGKRAFVVQTPYGRLTIPRSKVERIRKADGTEEVVAQAEARAATASAHRARLILVVMGRPFWQAWEPKEAPADPTLRLEVRLDEEPVATYLDAKQDPDDIPKAVVNTFSLLPADVTFQSGASSEVLPPEARPGRVVLKIDLPAEEVGSHRLRIAYQVNSGTTAEPAWKDVVGADAPCELKRDNPTYLQVKQDGGRMEYSGFMKRKMKNVDSFRLELSLEDGI
jgi:hypothetical protein